MFKTMKKIILFDFDGVIADSFWQAFEVQKMICPSLTKDIFRKMFEGNINDWKETMNIDKKECRSDIDFFTEYIPKMKNEVQIVPGMKDIIISLEKVYTLIIISSTISSPIREFLEKHDLANHFTEIFGNDVHKSKVEKIKMVFEKYKAKADDCVFITDTLGDIREAEKMNVKTIGITWGFHKDETLMLGNPFKLAKNPNDLLVTVSDYFNTSN